jgi:predicted O-methyltransferase YrrM
MTEDFSHGWNSEPEVGETLAALIKLTGARTIVECGTFQGATTLAMLKALPKDGRLITIDIEDNRCEALKKDKKHEFILGPTLQVLTTLNVKADLIFYDTVHEFEHQLREFKSGERLAAPICTHVFHDSIHVPGVLEFVKWMRNWYNVVNLPTPDNRGLAIATIKSLW